MAELKSPVATRQASALLPLSRFGTPSSLLAAPPCQQAAEALAQMGPAARAAVPALSETLNDPRLSSYRPYYALALLKIDRQAARVAVPVLIEALVGKDPALSEKAAPALRKQAASALGQMGDKARDAIGALGNALGDVDPGVRQQAARALGNIGAPAHDAVPSLRKALSDPDESVRSEATAALKRIGA